MAVPIGKLVMKSSTKVSLNERFTAYREQAESASTAFRDQLMNDRQASVENRRLAQQMANRPSVIAALRLKKRSMQQRLGQRRNAFASGNVKSRLNFNLRASPKMQGRLGQRGRGRNITQNMRGGGNRMRRGNFMRSGTSPMIKSRLGPPMANNRKFAPRGFPRKKNFFQNRQNQTNNLRNKFKRGIGRRGQSVRGRGGGRGGWNRNAKPIPTRQELDNDLDEYMSETKPIDSQFTHYM